MKLNKKFALVPIAAAMLGFGPAAHANWTASFNDLVNGVSGTLTDNGFSGGAEQYTLILNTSAYDSTTGSTNRYLDSVDIKAFSDCTSATFTASAGTWVDPAGTGGINNGKAGSTGCSGSNGGFACIEANPKGQAPLALALGSTYTFTYSIFGATGLNTTGLNAHVGVGYANASGLGPFAITSQLTVPSAVPEPETYAMLLAGLGLMGFVARRRQRKLAVA